MSYGVKVMFYPLHITVNFIEFVSHTYIGCPNKNARLKVRAIVVLSFCGTENLTSVVCHICD